MFPQEVLEHIVFFAATDNLLGPPSGIVPFLTLCRAMNNSLSFTNNPHLYARIFEQKYDLAAVSRRMGSGSLPATALAEELRRRSIVLRRFRNQKECQLSNGRTEYLDTMLWTAYLMVLESDGRNERQLREYARISQWLKDYWFHLSGASGAVRTVTNADEWLENTERMSLAIWLFWYMFRPGTYFQYHIPQTFYLWRRPEEYLQDRSLFKDATGILKIMALGAHRVRFSTSVWNYFIDDTSSIRHVIPTGWTIFPDTTDIVLRLSDISLLTCCSLLLLPPHPPSWPI